MRSPSLGRLVILVVAVSLARASSGLAYEFDSFSCDDPCIHNVAGHAVALRSFDLRLTSDDRHVRGLHAAPNDRVDGPETQFLLMMWDENAGPDDFHVVEMAPSAALYDLTTTGARWAHATAERCAGECRLEVDVGPEETFVLTGFYLQYLYDGERDHHVKRIAVVPGRDAESAYVTVAMQDNDGRRPFEARVDYLAVPSELVATPGYVDSGQRGVSGVFSEARPPGPAVLTGFSVNWSEDHHFKRLMIDVGEDRVQAAFHDNDEDRPFEHFVYFVVLSEPGDG